MRWWASAGLAILGACYAPAPATPARAPAGAPGAPDAAGSCRVSDPVCDPTVGDDTALALVRRRCAGCHAEGGKAAHPFLDAAALSHERGNIALRLSGCEMPPDATPLPADERARLIGWAACAPAEPGP